MLDADFQQEVSEQKVDRFRKYADRSGSLWRTFQLCLALVFIPLLVVILMIICPLDEIQNGLSRKNWFQPLIFLMGGAQCVSLIATRYIALVPNTSLSTKHHITAETMAIISSTIALIIVEKTLVYPVPFSQLFYGNTTCLTTALCYLLFEGNNLKQVRGDMFKVLISIAISFSLLASHIFVGVIYTAQTDPLAQSAVALLLPALKFVYRYFVARQLKDEREGLGAAIIAFEIEYFNTLYISIFMQTATNKMVLLSLVCIDMFENLSFLIRMNQIAKVVNKKDSKDDKLKRRFYFQTKMVVLVELVEVVTPILYGTYLCILRQLPNLRFYEDLNQTTDMDFYDSIWNLALLGVFELFSLLAFIGTLKYRFQMPVFSQMGYFINENKYIILSMMNMWLALALSTPLLHVGNDFSFTFDAEYFKFLV